MGSIATHFNKHPLWLCWDPQTTFYKVVDQGLSLQRFHLVEDIRESFMDEMAREKIRKG